MCDICVVLCESVYRPDPEQTWEVFWRKVQAEYTQTRNDLREFWAQAFYEGFTTTSAADAAEDAEDDGLDAMGHALSAADAAEDDGLDAMGHALLWYDRWVQKAVIATALALGWYHSVPEAVLYRELADRYCRRAEWSMDILVAAFCEPDLPPPPNETHCHSWWEARNLLPASATRALRQGQIALF